MTTGNRVGVNREHTRGRDGERGRGETEGLMGEGGATRVERGVKRREGGREGAREGGS